MFYIRQCLPIVYLSLSKQLHIKLLTDWIFVKILPQKYLWTRKKPLNVGTWKLHNLNLDPEFLSEFLSILRAALYAITAL